MMLQPHVLEGQLTVSQLMTEHPTTVHVGMTLGDVADVLKRGRHQHVLVCDDSGAVVGVISSQDLVQHLLSYEDESQHSWKDLPVQGVMATKFISSTPDAHPEDVASFVSRSEIRCVPVLERGQLVGVLTADDFLMSWNRMYPVLQQAAIDSVTSLPTRATFERRVLEEWDRAARYGLSLGLLMIDVDYFKMVNDQCGHQTGDAVLNMIGHCLRRHLRSYDVVARYGGDEFAALCCGCRPEDISVPVNRVLESVGRLTVPAGLGRQSLTLSIGASVQTQDFRAHTPQDLIAAADKALYEAKRHGRGRAFQHDFLDFLQGTRAPHQIGACISARIPSSDLTPAM